MLLAEGLPADKDEPLKSVATSRPVAEQSSLVMLASEEGQSRLQEALQEPSCYGHASVVKAWYMQRGMTTCGLASLAIVLSSAGEVFVDEDDVLSLVEHAADVPDRELVNRRGLTLAELEAIASAMPSRIRAAHRSHAGIGAETRTPETFRRTLVQALTSKDIRVVLNYNLGDLGAADLHGHFSPVAAYHDATDSLLICDTWWTTEPMWAPLEKVFLATIGLDSDSKEPRGLLTLECIKPSEHSDKRK